VKFKPRGSYPVFPPLQPPVLLMDHERSYNPSYREGPTGHERGARIRGAYSLCPNCAQAMHFCLFWLVWHNMESITYVPSVKGRRTNPSSSANYPSKGVCNRALYLEGRSKRCNTGLTSWSEVV